MTIEVEGLCESLRVSVLHCHELEEKVSTLRRENDVPQEKTVRLSELYLKAQRQVDFYRETTARSRKAVEKFVGVAKGVIEVANEKGKQ